MSPTDINDTDISDSTAAAWAVATDESQTTSHAVDLFDHSRYATALRRYIDSSKTGATVGLFGAYGSGKSWIVRELSSILAKEPDAYTVLSYDAWRYSEDELRRDLLVSLRDQVVRDYGILEDRFTWNEDSFHVDTETKDEGPSEFSWEAFWKAATDASILGFIYLALGALTGVIVAGLSAGWSWSSVLAALPGAAVTGIVFATGVFRQLTDVDRLSVKSVTISARRRIELAEEFSESFSEIASVRPKASTIVVVDNIDRCEPRVALRVLSMIKTFLEPASPRTFFVVPCDPDAIERHLAAEMKAGGVEEDQAGRDAKEYLGKLFPSRLRVFAISEFELRAAAKASLAEISLGQSLSDEEMASVSAIAAAANRDNPRAVKLFINDVSMSALLHSSATGGNAQHLSAVDIAKLLALRNEDVGVMTAVERTPWLLREIETSLTTTGDWPASAPMQRREGAARLLVSLAWHQVSERSIREFSGLRLPAVAADIPSYFDLIVSLEDGAVSTAKRLFDEAAEASRDAFIDVVVGSVRSAVGPSQAAPLSVAIALLSEPSLTNSQRSSLAQTLDPTNTTAAAQIGGPDVLVGAIEQSSGVPRSVLVTSFVHWFGSVAEARAALLTAAIRVLGGFPDEDLAEIRAAITSSIEKDPSLEEVLRPSPIELRVKLLSDAALDRLVSDYQLPQDAAGQADVADPVERLVAHAPLLGDRLSTIEAEGFRYLFPRREAGVPFDSSEASVLTATSRIAAAAAGADGRADVLSEVIESRATSERHGDLAELLRLLPQLEPLLTGSALDILVELFLRGARDELEGPAAEAYTEVAAELDGFTTHSKRKILELAGKSLVEHDHESLARVVYQLTKDLDDWDAISAAAEARAENAPARLGQLIERWSQFGGTESDLTEFAAESIAPLMRHLLDEAQFQAAGRELFTLSTLWGESECSAVAAQATKHLTAEGGAADLAARLIREVESRERCSAVDLRPARDAAVTAIIDGTTGLDAPDSLADLQLEALGQQAAGRLIEVRTRVQERLEAIEPLGRALQIAERLCEVVPSDADTFLKSIAEFALQSEDEEESSAAVATLRRLAPLVGDAAIQRNAQTLRELAKRSDLAPRYTSSLRTNQDPLSDSDSSTDDDREEPSPTDS